MSILFPLKDNQPTSMRDITATAEFELDFSLRESYTGSGDVKNIIKNPASGATQTEYDMSPVGAGHNFVGEVGSSDAYMELNGSNYFQVASNPTFIDNLHRNTRLDTNSHWAAALVYKTSTAEAAVISSLANTNGMRLTAHISGTDAARSSLAVDGTGFDTTGNANLATDTWELLIYQSGFSILGASFRIYTRGISVSTAPANTTSSANADGLLTWGANPAGTTALAANSRIKFLAFGSGVKLNDKQIALMVRMLRDRHNIPLTGWS